MASVGTLLRRERERKRLQIGDIATATKIPERYLRSIEKDDYGGFPAETYLVGFIRNYARELELDPNEIVSLYKNTKLEKEKSLSSMAFTTREVAPQTESAPKLRRPLRAVEPPRTAVAAARAARNEQSGNAGAGPQPQSASPVPRLPGSWSLSSMFREIGKFFAFLVRNQITLLISLGAVVVIVILVFVLVNLKNLPKGNANDGQFSKIQVIQFDQSAGVFDLNLNEYYKLKLGRGFYSVMGEILASGTGSDTPETTVKLLFHFNNSIFELAQNLRKDIDIDLDGALDLSLKLNSISESSFNLAFVKLREFSTNIMTNAPPATNSGLRQSGDRKDPKTEAFTSIGAKKKIVFRAEFLSKAYVKAWVDSQESDGKVYLPSQVLELTAQDVLQLKIGNASGMKVTVNGIPVKLGAGAVNKTIKWKRDLFDENVYNLVIANWQ